jgi:hypothetical protein
MKETKEMEPLDPTPHLHPSHLHEETSAITASTTAMGQELACLSAFAVVACLYWDHDELSQRASRNRSALALASGSLTLGHQPEDFLIDFKFPHQCDMATALEWLPIGNLDIHIKPWRMLLYGDHCGLPHHVCLCLEGIPTQAWNESIAKRAIARACNLVYVETASLRRDNTRALCLWAWTHNPSDIAKVTCLSEGARQHHTTRGRRGLTFRLVWEPGNRGN